MSPRVFRTILTRTHDASALEHQNTRTHIRPSRDSRDAIATLSWELKRCEAKSMRSPLVGRSHSFHYNVHDSVSLIMVDSRSI